MHEDAPSHGIHMIQNGNGMEKLGYTQLVVVVVRQVSNTLSITVPVVCTASACVCQRPYQAKNHMTGELQSCFGR